MANDVFRDLLGNPALFRTYVAKTSSYTILPKDNGVCFTNKGASGSVTFTLPALAPGYSFWFFVDADQTVTVQSAAGDDIIGPNDRGLDSVAFSTSGDKLGGSLWITSDLTGSRWYVWKTCSNALTLVS